MPVGSQPAVVARGFDPVPPAAPSGEHVLLEEEIPLPLISAFCSYGDRLLLFSGGDLVEFDPAKYDAGADETPFAQAKGRGLQFQLRVGANDRLELVAGKPLLQRYLVLP